MLKYSLTHSVSKVQFNLRCQMGIYWYPCTCGSVGQCIHFVSTQWHKGCWNLNLITFLSIYMFVYMYNHSRLLSKKGLYWLKLTIDRLYWLKLTIDRLYWLKLTIDKLYWLKLTIDRLYWLKLTIDRKVNNGILLESFHIAGNTANI